MTILTAQNSTSEHKSNGGVVVHYGQPTASQVAQNVLTGGAS